MTGSEVRPSIRLGRIQRVGGRLAGLLFVAVCLSAIPGCDSNVDRAQGHLERGREYLAEGNRDAALIEFNNALRADPRNPAASVELGEIATREGDLEGALFYFHEAAGIAPDDPRIQANLAIVIRHDDLPRARRMINELLQREPDYALAHAAASQIAQAEGNYQDGLENAKRAVELGPEDSDLWWNLGLAYKIVIFRDRTLGKSSEESVYQDAVNAFDRYVALGGKPVWTARLEQAVIVEVQPGRDYQAVGAAIRALDTTQDLGNRRARYRAAEQLAKVARRAGARTAYAKALEAFIELNPRDLVAWSNLATVRAEAGGSAEAVYRRLIEQDPQDIDAHILYATHLMRTRGLRSGMQYYENQTSADHLPAAMLAALHFTQTTTGMFSEASATLKRLQAEHPDDPWTAISIARDEFRQRKTRQVIARLRSLVANEPIPAALVLLSRAERSSGNYASAAAFARKASKVAKRFEPRALLALAEATYSARKFDEALEALTQYSARVVLKEDQQILLAKLHYENRNLRMGRKILRELAERPYPNVDALVEWSERDRGRPMQRDRLRVALEAGTRFYPDDFRTLTQLVLLDFEAGQQGLALQRLGGRSLLAAPSPLLTLRARLRLDQGDTGRALRDAVRVYERNPATPGIVDLLVLIHAKRGTSEAQIERLTKRLQETPSGEADTPRRTGSRIFLSKLLVQQERIDEAIRVLEEAGSADEAPPALTIDLAYLYAWSGRKLEEAERLARIAVDRETDNARARDTLGFVYLKQENLTQAIEQFRLAIEYANPPQPLYHYHLCSALNSSGQPKEALEQIETVLRLDPRYPQAIEIRDRLKSSVESELEASGYEPASPHTLT